MSKKGKEQEVDIESKTFLYDYLNAFSPVGQETEGQKIWIDYIKQFTTNVNKDAYGTAWGIYSNTKLFPVIQDRKKVVIEAHCDEIAWIITHIESDGYIRVKRHGGSDNMIASSKSVIIHTHDGQKVKGFFGSPAIHVREKNTTMGPEQHELWLDVGVDSLERVKELGIEVGCIATFDDQFQEVGDYYVGRSLDNKIGGYIIAEVLRQISEEKIKLPYDLYVVNSVQEEVGLFGARLIAKRLQADIAFVHDVCHNTNHPKMNKSKDGDIKGGEGPCLEYTSQNHRGINSMIRDIAKVNKIPVQLTVGSYGNDTVSFFLENTPTAILASPLKYMHTTVEMVHKKDVESCIKLYVEILKSITPEWIDSIKNPKI
jgi:putative aminopeptidase FrvX